MKISDLQAWLEKQKSLHGDLELVCVTAFGNIAEQAFLTDEYLAVKKSEDIHITERTAGAKFVTIGYSD